MDYVKVIDQVLGKALFIQEFNNNIYMPTIANSVMLKGNNRESVDMTFENLNFKPITIKAKILTRFALN